MRMLHRFESKLVLSLLFITSITISTLGEDEKPKEEPPSFHGEEILPLIPCEVDFPRIHLNGPPTIAELDNGYVNAPFSKGASNYAKALAGPLTSPGIFIETWPTGSVTAEGKIIPPGGLFQSFAHLLFVEFPVKSAAACLAKALEHRETWFRLGGQSSYSKVSDSTIPDPKATIAPSFHWTIGVNPANPDYPESLIFSDAPGGFVIQRGQDFGNYVNIRLNIHDADPPYAIRGTASLRLPQRLEGGSFRSELAGSAAGGSAQVGAIELDPEGYPANAPSPIPDVFRNHPLYVGQSP